MRVDREEPRSLRGNISRKPDNTTAPHHTITGGSVAVHYPAAEQHVTFFTAGYQSVNQQSIQMASSDQHGSIPARTERSIKRVDGTTITPARRSPASAKRKTISSQQQSVQSMQSVPTSQVSPAATDIWLRAASDEIILEMPAQAHQAKVAAIDLNTNASHSRVTPPQRENAIVRSARMSQIIRKDLASLQPAPPNNDDECSICHGAGFVRRDVPLGHPSFGKIFPCTCKRQQLEQQRRAELWKLSQLSAFEEMRFDTFNPRIPGVTEAFQVAQEYAADPSGWLVLGGPCGSGKTHLAAAIANQQFESGTLILFSVVPILLDHLRSTFAPNSEITYDALFDKVLNAGLLVLDDLGAEHSTAWAQEKLFQILNFRYMYRMPTVITTNIELLSDLDDRVRSRLTDVSVVRYVQIRAQDYRPRNVPHR